MIKCKPQLRSVSHRAALAAGGQWVSSRMGPQEGRDGHVRVSIPSQMPTLGAQQLLCGDDTQPLGCEKEGSLAETTPLCPKEAEIWQDTDVIYVLLQVHRNISKKKN